jgi:hypothetical protein
VGGEDGDVLTHDYCVQGDTLTLASEDGVMEYRRVAEVEGAGE